MLNLMSVSDNRQTDRHTDRPTDRPTDMDRPRWDSARNSGELMENSGKLSEELMDMHGGLRNSGNSDEPFRKTQGAPFRLDSLPDWIFETDGL